MWLVELSEFDIKFKPRMAIKPQALAEFIAELTTPPDLLEGQKVVRKIFVDRSSHSEGSKAGIIII